jgi:hypothetical protein
MVIRALGGEAGSGKCGGGKLERGVVSNVESSIRYQARCTARLQVSIGDGEEIGDFLTTCLVVF